MRVVYYYNKVLMVMALLAVLLTACSSSEDFDEEEKPVQLVVAHFNFSLPQRIVGKRKAPSTRMSDDVVQANADVDPEKFRGIDQIRMFCFNTKPDANSNKIGNVIEMNTKSSNVSEEVTTDDHSYSKEIDVPVGTSYFSFYANAEEEAIPSMTEHERRMHYGVVEAIGIDKKTYTGNSSIRFKPVPICKSKDKLGGSAKGEALLSQLNYLMNIRVNNVPAPNDRWETAANLYLNEAYQRMTQLTTLSSYNVQTMLGVILKMINQEAPDDQASKLVEKITKAIKDICDEEKVDIENGVIVLKDAYQGFPEDLYLPAGAARIQWDEEENSFVVPDVHAYGKGLNVPSVSDYVYPMNLQYQVLSDIVASDELVINEVNDEGEVVPPETAKYNKWSDVLNEGYGLDADKAVQPTTRSVAMVQQVEYAVGSLALRARITPSVTIYDAKGKPVDVSNGFTLKGYIVGGQREVDYDFQPVEDSPVYAIYDTDLNKGKGETSVSVKQRQFSDDDLFDYILGLSTEKNQNIQLAMELVNNCPDFQGADGVIAHGATFYLVANLALEPNSSSDIRQIFSKANSTQVNLTVVSGWPDKDGDGIPDPELDEHDNPQPINGLATATYGLPSLEIPHPTVGLSVDLNWGEGLWFDDVEL